MSVKPQKLCHSSLKLAVMGAAGATGDAMVIALIDQGHEVTLYDPPAGMSSNMSDVTMAFICVPAPTDYGTLTVGLDDIKQCLGVLASGTIAVLRSTVPPGTTDALQEEYPDLSLFFMPEFLTEATRIEDAKNPSRTILGVPGSVVNSVETAAFETLMDLFNYGDEPKHGVAARSAEMAKYVANTFYALKVTYFNQIFDLCNAAGINYEDIRTMVGMDPWTGAQHTEVLHGGYRGFSGKCLPKDLEALLGYAAKHAVRMSLLEETRAYNDVLTHRRQP